MAISNQERITKALELLREGLGPFVERELTNKAKIPISELGTRVIPNDRLNAQKTPSEWDVSALVTVMWDTWQNVFAKTLGYAERSLVSEIRSVRNQWAHQQPFSGDDTYRALDSMERLLNAISAPLQAAEVAQSKSELLRIRYDEQLRNERRKASTGGVENRGNITLPPWREIVTPHKDVATGNYQNAEFAADLWQVYLGNGPEEYSNPIEFFRRTYITSSLRDLLENAIKRISGTGGDPVIQLQTNFGGGKTHSMLALYHLFSGTKGSDLLGIEEVLRNSVVTEVPKAKKVVLVGNKLSPSSPSIKDDGTRVHTLWGEIAYQLGGKEAYDFIREDDINATSPGDALRVLMNKYGPCLILIDEWVAYARMLEDDKVLPGGSFDTQFTFAQSLTEAAKTADRCLLVVSLPASESQNSPHVQADSVEVGGERGRAALNRLQNVVGRLESSWRPASAEESFEIVRRRLFGQISSREQFIARDNVAREFFQLYITNASEFPTECKESEYEKRLRDAYPIHPEVFDRLYGDWSTLIKFQRTRGVLRLMAAVIHSLWISGDRNPLILPANIPIDESTVRSELTRYLSDNWTPVIEKDVDGASSLPVRTDSEVPNLGKYAACKRVARTIYLGSAPTLTAANKGLETRRVKLGCVMPGEPPSVFSDALRRLSSSATYLYEDGSRYWYDTQPTVAKLVEDRAEQLKNSPDRVSEELRKRLREHMLNREGFGGVHIFPTSGADVPDELEVRLVVLGSDHPYAKDPNGRSPAEVLAHEIVDSRGNSPRRYRNTLVFSAPDQSRLSDIEQSIRRYLAWQSVLDDKEHLNLDPFQVRQATNQKESANQSVNAQIPETYKWLLVPVQQNPKVPMTISVLSLNGQDKLPLRVMKKLRNEELLLTSLAGTRLRLELDKIPLWRGDSVSISQLVEDFASYTYLPRVVSPEVIYKAIENGVRLLTWRYETFAFAEGYDDLSGVYKGLFDGISIDVSPGNDGLIVRADVAAKQLKNTPSEASATETVSEGLTSIGTTSQGEVSVSQPLQSESKKKVTRYHATVELDPSRSIEVPRIYDEIISHLSTADVNKTRVKVTLEIEATDENGFSDSVIRTVTENGHTLKFRNQGFEES